eukprot:334032-Pelagomonas_calceolata.AAC.1
MGSSPASENQEAADRRRTLTRQLRQPSMRGHPTQSVSMFYLKGVAAKAAFHAWTPYTIREYVLLERGGS